MTQLPDRSNLGTGCLWLGVNPGYEGCDTSIATNKNWGIFGLGSLSGKNCVVSTARFGNKHFDRLSKVSIHEVGHTLGIPHCNSDVNCLMNDAKG